MAAKQFPKLFFKLKRNALKVSVERVRYFNDCKKIGHFLTVTSIIAYRPYSNYNGNQWNKRDGKTHSSWFQPIGIGAILVSSAATIYYVNTKSSVQAKTQSKGKQNEVVKIYTEADVREHDSAEKRIWVSFQNGVYDITDFVNKHPGGDKIMMAAGGSLEPFWLLYAVHNNPEVLKLLENYRIGNLDEKDVGQAVKNMEDPYANDPKRHPALRARSVKPFNAETPGVLLVESHITSNDLFFVRNHLPVPAVDVKTYRLEICGPGLKTLSFTLNDIKKLPKHTITAALQCTGNRRSEMIQVKPVKGLDWNIGAIGNATWTGVKLRDLLMRAGLKDENTTIEHIQFEGLDMDPTGATYGASILREKAMDPAGDVLVAYEMNGKPLSSDHGFPLRIIAPGITGARNVKWLARIVASEAESDSHWQQNDYKSFSPNVDWDTVDFKSTPAIQDTPVQSAICDPTPDSKLTVNRQTNCITVRGYAWSGGGRKVIRVDVTADNGKNWYVAQMDPDSSPLTKAWAWRLWKIDIPVPSDVPDGAKLEICSRAVDSSYNVQPDSVSNIWNLRGVVNNAWHRVRVTIQKK